MCNILGGFIHMFSWRVVHNQNYGKDYADVVYNTSVILNGVKENNFLCDEDDIWKALQQGKEKNFESKCWKY